MEKKMEEAVKDLNEMIKIQCMDGNWNYDPYLHGIANGLICALSVVTREAPKYVNAPKEWLCDRPKEERNEKRNI